MIECLKNWLFQDENEKLKKLLCECQAQVAHIRGEKEIWREKAQAAERDVMEARQVAQYWREQAKRNISLPVDDLFPWEERVIKANGLSFIEQKVSELLRGDKNHGLAKKVDLRAQTGRAQI